jgi:hypothetical protein
MSDIKDKWREIKSGHPLWEYGFHYPLSSFRHQLLMSTRERNTAFKNKLRLLGEALALDYNEKIKPYGGLSWEGPLPDWIPVEGMDRQHLKLRVEVAASDWYETVQESLDNMGFGLQAWDRYQTEDEALRHRPYVHAVAFNYAGPREKNEWYWVYVKPQEIEGFGMSAGVAKGMDRHRRQTLQDAVLRARTESVVDHYDKVMNERVTNNDVKVRVLWRGRAVGDASLGGCELDDSFEGRKNSSISHQVASFLLDNGLINEAVASAESWADSEVDNIKARAGKLTESVALLPERSHAVIKQRARE